MSAVFVTVNGSAPIGEKVVKSEKVADAPTARLSGQLKPAALSSSVSQVQVLSKDNCEPIRPQTAL